MSEYHDEQANIERLKSFWKNYRKAIFLVLAPFILLAIVWSGLLYFNKKLTAKAAVQYVALEKAVSDKNIEPIKTQVALIQKEFSATVYAPMSALLAAKTLAEANQNAEAQSLLEWVIDKSKNDEYRQIARLHLAGLLLDQQKYEQSLSILEKNVTAPFESLYADRRGDIFYKQNQFAQARTAYQFALEKLTPDDGALRQIIQLKLNALGTETTPLSSTH